MDWIKAVAILAVVLVHCLSPSMTPSGRIAVWLGDWTRFAVPGLIFAAGFLFHKNIVADAVLLKRLAKRIGPPYLFCSTLILLAKSVCGQFDSLPAILKTVAFDLAFANAVGIYYFVFVIAYLYAFSFILKRLPPAAIFWIWIVSLILLALFFFNILIFMPVSPRWFFFVLLRCPILYLPFYLAGWLCDLHRHALQKAMYRGNKRAWIILAALLIMDALTIWRCTIATDFACKQIAIQFHIALTLAWLSVLAFMPNHTPRSILFLSRQSYAIFLLHFPIVRALQNGWLFFGNDYAASAIVPVFAGALLISLGLIQLGGKISKTWAAVLIGSRYSRSVKKHKTTFGSK